MSDEAPRLRDATAADAATIAAIYNESIAVGDSTMDQEPMPVERQAAMIAKLDLPLGYVVLMQGEDTLGWGVLKPISDRRGYRFAAEVSLFLRRDQVRRGLYVSWRAGVVLAHQLRGDP